MAKLKKPVPVKKVIWRMSGNAPLGEYVTTGDSVNARDDKILPLPEVRSSWKVSSIELREGIQISEQPLDTLPGELIDEFFKR